MKPVDEPMGAADESTEGLDPDWEALLPAEEPTSGFADRVMDALAAEERGASSDLPGTSFAKPLDESGVAAGPDEEVLVLRVPDNRKWSDSTARVQRDRRGRNRESGKGGWVLAIAAGLALVVCGTGVGFWIAKPDGQVVEEAPMEPASDPKGVASEQPPRSFKWEAKKAFERVKLLVKHEKWDEAMVMVRFAVDLEPDNQLYLEYLGTIEREATASRSLEEAENLLRYGAYERSLETLRKIPTGSLTALKARELEKQAMEQREKNRPAPRRAVDGLSISSLLNQAKSALDEGRFDDAMDAAELVLVQDEGHLKAASLKKEAEQARSAIVKAMPSRVKPTGIEVAKETARTALLRGACLTAYLAGDLEKAKSEAGPSGVGSEATEKLGKLDASYRKGKDLSKDVGKSRPALDHLEKALALDLELAGGKGRIRTGLKRTLAKVHFLRGVDFKTRRKYPEAYREFRKALEYKPDLGNAIDLLDDLNKIGRRFYQESYVIKGTNPQRAIEQLDVVLKIVPEDDPYYRKALKLRATIQGGDAAP